MINHKRNGSAIELVFPFFLLLTLQLLFTQGYLIDIFIKNSAKICRIAKNERFTSVSPQ